MITNIEDYKPHEVICIYCINRLIFVHEQSEWVAKCGIVGCIIYIYIYIYTGQPL